VDSTGVRFWGSRDTPARAKNKSRTAVNRVKKTGRREEIEDKKKNKGGGKERDSRSKGGDESLRRRGVLSETETGAGTLTQEFTTGRKSNQGGSRSEKKRKRKEKAGQAWQGEIPSTAPVNQEMADVHPARFPYGVRKEETEAKRRLACRGLPRTERECGLRVAGGFNSRNQQHRPSKTERGDGERIKTIGTHAKTEGKGGKRGLYKAEGKL